MKVYIVFILKHNLFYALIKAIKQIIFHIYKHYVIYNWD